VAATPSTDFQRGFQNLHDAAIHILGPCAGPGHIDIHLGQHDIGEILRADVQRGHQPANQHQHHHQIGQRPVADKVGQDTARLITL
jgi:hypothetical protein